MLLNQHIKGVEEQQHEVNTLTLNVILDRLREIFYTVSIGSKWTVR